MPRCVWSIKALTSVFLLLITSDIFTLVASSDIKSLMPTLYALVFIYSVTIFWRLSINRIASLLPKSLQMRWIMPFEPLPSTPFSICPRRYSPLTISKTEFEVLKSSLSLKRFVLYFKVIGGRICDKIWKLVISVNGNLLTSTLSYAISKFIASRALNLIFSRVKR